MNRIERLRGTLAFRETDRVPVLPQVFAHAAVVAGVGVAEYLQHGETLAASQLAAQRRYGYDAVFGVMGLTVEAEAAGAGLRYRRDQYPEVCSPALKRGASPESLPEVDPEVDGRMPEVLRAVRILRDSVGDELPVVGCVAGPMTLAMQLMGAEAALYTAIDEPELFAALLEYTAKTGADFAAAQVLAGAHVCLVFDPASSPDVVPPAFFRELVAPKLSSVLAASKKAGALFTWLHVAGPVDPILRFYPGLGADVVNIDYCVDLPQAMKRLPGTCINGTVKSLSFVQESADSLTRSCAELIHAFSGRGGFVLSSGCEIPVEADPRNITAMVRAAGVEASS